MIVVQNENGHLVKVFHHLENGLYGIHNLFGLVSERSFNTRINNRKKKGLSVKDARWKCQFDVRTTMQNNEEHILLTPKANCEAVSLDNKRWKLETPSGNYILSLGNGAGALFEGETITHEGSEDLWRSVGYSSVIVALIFAILWMLIPEKVEEEITKPIEVTMIKDQKTVMLKRPIAKAPTKMTKEQKAKRAVKQNLGFLGMLGTNKIKKVVGGAPTDLKDVSVGAGQGSAGSGGELIAGLGKGVRKTTVGNTGVAGLGGIGTKGAGGGKGGYGSVSVASGEGAGISTIAVSSDMVLEGGLSKYAVQATIAKYLNQVRACYEQGLQRIPGLTGTVSVNFEVSAAGAVNYSKVRKSSLGDKGVESCITTKMMGWEFPKPKGGQAVQVNYPFLLRPVRS